MKMRGEEQRGRMKTEKSFVLTQKKKKKSLGFTPLHLGLKEGGSLYWKQGNSPELSDECYNPASDGICSVAKVKNISMSSNASEKLY